MRINKLLGLLAIGAVSLLGGVDSALGQAFVPPVLTPGVDYTIPNFLYSPPLRKFVTALPGVGPTATNEIGQYMAIAVPDTQTYSKAAGRPNNDDYYEIALVEYREQMHPDLPPVVGDKLSSVNGGTQLRGYVQLETDVIKGKHIPLTYPGGAPILINGSQAYAVDYPHYLGPSILATSEKAVRLKFHVLLPTGSKGHLFIPAADPTIMGAAEGPNQIGVDGFGMPIYEMYTENRATIHLHGGLPPWISDGTPHQWTAAQGENTTYKRGASVYNVPDMPDPGEGALTFYFPNQMSARLQFYHDHAFGLTGPNVYVGEAAGYIILDKPGTGEWTLPGIADLGIGGVGIPLVIQDRTFLPDPATVQALDPTWNTVGPWNLGAGMEATWGTNGNFWYPHVYIPNQNPYDDSGWNPLGRWAYGPWFWPPWPVPAGSTPPNPTHVPEAFMDTPMVNGTPYPYLNVEPKAYRFRMLNACNDRTVNLSLWQAEPLTIGITNGGSGYENPIVTVAPPANGGTAATATAKLDYDGVISDILITSYGSGYTNLERPLVTITDANGGPGTGAYASASALSDVAMIPAIANRYSTVPIPAYYPTPDLRDGGWPDPRMSGPNFIQIGTEGGLLPKPVKIENRPIGYVLDKGNIVVLNVQERSVNLACAERADVIVDFSQFAGKTVILYNDSGAPVPAGDPRYDLYTGCPDQRDASGAPPTLAGYGPNTRTIMQFRVANTTPQPYNMSGLSNALAAAFKATQPTPIVPQIAYDGLYDRAGAKTNVVSRINSTSLNFVPYGLNQATNFPMLPKAIHELFDDIGRLNTILAMELPFTTAQIQTTVPLYYVDPTTEIYNDGETQIWKITHNGVDTHPIHFHLYNVQIINRVGWDNLVRPPDDNELGWKETVRMNPLEDCIVAARAISPTNLPFMVPDSVRPLNPARPLGSLQGFSNLDPLTGNRFVPAISNVMANFAWEYVWHCHILAHEENDMMRPLVMQVSPASPSNLRATAGTTGTVTISLAWNDNSPNLANPNKESGFIIERASVVGGVTNAYAQLGSVGANVRAYVDSTGLAAGNRYLYRVSAFNAGISAPSAVATAIAPMISLLISPSGIITSNQNIAFKFTPPTGASQFRILFGNRISAYISLAGVTNAGVATIITNLTGIGNFNWAIQVRSSAGVAQGWSSTNTVTVVVPAAPIPAGPSGAVVTNAPVMTFAASQYAADYLIVVSNTATALRTTSTWFTATSAGVPNGTGTGSHQWDGTLLGLGSYRYAMQARDLAGTSALSGFVAFTLATPAAPVKTSPAGNITNAIPSFVFAASATATDYQIVMSNGVTGTLDTSAWFTATSAGVPAGTGTGTHAWWGSALTVGNYMWAIQAQNPLGTGAISSFTAFSIVGPSAPAQIAPSGNIIQSVPAFTFTAIPSATDYQIVFHDGATYTTSAWFTASSAGVGSGTGTGSYTWTGTPLTFGSYSWAITARSAVGAGTTSTYMPFTVVPLAAPTPVGPSGTLVIASPTYSFGAVSGATDYQVVLSNSAGVFTTSAWFTASSAGVPSGTGTGTYAQPTPLPIDSYSWAVQARNATGPGVQSPFMAFSVVGPNAPAQIGPSGNTPITTPVFTFTAVANATDYQVLLTSGATTTTSAWVTATSAGVPAGTGTGSITWGSDLALGNYTWTIRAQNTVGVGSFSPLMGFSLVVVGAVTPTSPVMGATVYSGLPSLNFQAVAGATDYRLILYNNATRLTTTSAWYTASSLGVAAGTGTGTLIPNIPLSAGGYWWAIQGQSPVGEGAAPVTSLSITIAAPTAPIPVSPSNGANVADAQPNFTFTGQLGVSEYQVVIYSVSSASYTTSSWFSASSAGIPTGAGTGSVTWESPLTIGTYSYFLLARSSSGSSPASRTVGFMIVGPAGPAPVSPGNVSTVTTPTPTFSFGAVTGALDYQIILYSMTTRVTTYSPWVSAAAAGVPAGTGTGSITWGAALPVGNYYWAVQARNAAGTGSAGASWFLTIAP